jgi:SAM-dependent MidA family methyltransferase
LESLFGTTDAASLRPLTRDGVIELRPATKVLLGEAASVAREVCLVTIDYGDWLAGIHDADACGPCRSPPGEVPHGRTLRGYFRHQVTSDLCARVSHQDLTADVDFRALDMHGTALGFETVLYVTVAEFLRGAGAEVELDRARKAASTSLDIDREATVLAALLDPEDVGGRFKVMLQVRE